MKKIILFIIIISTFLILSFSFAAGEIGECLGKLVDFDNGGPKYGLPNVASDVATYWIIAKHYFPVKNVNSQNKDVLIKLRGPGNYNNVNGPFGSKILNIEDSIPANTVRLYLLDTVTAFDSGSEEFSALGYMDFTINNNTIDVTSSSSRKGTIAHIGGCFTRDTQRELNSFGYSSQFNRRSSFEKIRIVSTNVDTLINSGWTTYYVQTCAGSNLAHSGGVPTDNKSYTPVYVSEHIAVTDTVPDSLVSLNSNTFNIHSQSTADSETGWYLVTTEYNDKVYTSAREEDRSAPWGACSIYAMSSSDTTPPLGIITIKNVRTLLNGKEAVNNRNVTLQIMAVDNESGVVEMALANENARTTPIVWESYTGGVLEKEWQLSAGDGEKTVYLMLKNADGATTVSFVE